MKPVILVRTSTSTSHGPKVIPPAERFETARYGDRPFPVVPVQYTDRAYTAEVVINNKVAGIGRGPSKQTAEKDAALNALVVLDIEA